MIKSISPYYVTIPLVSPLTSLTCTQYTLEVYVWDGLKTSVPSTASFSITKDNATASTGNVDINIGFMINSLLTFTKQEGSGTGLINGKNQMWVKYQTYYTTSDPIDLTVPSNINTQLMVKGYGYGMDGKNSDTPSNLIMMSSGTEYRVARDGYFIVPIEVPETTTAAATLTIDSITQPASYISIDWSSTGSVSDVTLQYRIQPSTTWIFNGTNISDPQFFTPPSVGTYDIRLRGYDTANATYIYSNIDNHTET